MRGTGRVASAERLKRNRDFSRVYRHGVYRSGRWLGLHAFSYGGKSRKKPSRVGFTVSRAIRGAVPRNRARRLLKESFRLSGVEIASGYDLIATARWQPENEPALMLLTDEISRMLVGSGAGFWQTDPKEDQAGFVRDEN